MSHDREPDLAAIILSGEARHRDGWWSRVRASTAELRTPRAHEHDASSVAVLVLAILGIGLILGFAVDAVRGDDVRPPISPTASPTAGALQAPGADQVADAARTADRSADPVAAAPVAGVQLVASRVTAAKTPGRYGATVRVRVGNAGGTALGIDRGVLMTVLVDGGVVAARPVVLAAATADGPAVRAEAFQLESCTAGTHAVTVVLDSSARIDEANEGDNAQSAQLDWSC